MPVIRIAFIRGEQESDGHPAAAMFAATLAKASEPVPDLAVKGQMRRAERTRPKNPNRLTRRQHVFPVRSMQQFVNQSGRVSVFDMLRRKVRPARPDDILFCARRAWGPAHGSLHEAHRGQVSANCPTDSLMAEPTR